MSFARKDNVASSIIYCYAFITGDDLKKGKCNNDNLKEIFMDDSEFYTCHHLILDALADLKTPRFKDACIFEYCNKALERVSIRNARVRIFGEPSVPIPQAALIKFVRRIPTLRWFRSDLSKEHIIMLKTERPDIELLN